jgi:hypothetical protein
VQTLKTYGNWQLNSYSSTKYGFYKTGRGRIYVATTYRIENVNPEIETGVFNIPTKKEALKLWAEFKRTHSIGGAELRAELFLAVSNA